MPDSSPPEDAFRLQARLAGVLAVALDCIVMIDHEGHFIDFNPAAERTFGYRKVDVLGREMSDLIVPPAYRDRHREGMARLTRGGAPRMLGRRIEIVAMRADGTEFPVELAITQIDLPNGPPVFAAHLRDITERKLAEASLASMQSDLDRRFAERTEALRSANRELEREIADRRRREQLQNATYRISEATLESADLSALFERVHRIIGELMPANNCYIALLNSDRSVLSFPRFIDESAPIPPPRKPGRGLTEYVINTGRPLLASETDMNGVLAAAGYNPIGLLCKIWIGAPLMVAGRAIGAIALQDYRDRNAYNEGDLRLLTFVAEQLATAVQRKQAEDARRLAEEAYRSIFENAPEGLYQSSPDGRFLRVNQALAVMFGYSDPEEMIFATKDISVQLYVASGRRDDFFRLAEKADEVTDFRSEVYRRDWSTFWVSESVRVLRSGDGMIRVIEGVVIDITQQREVERILNEAKETADAANRAKSQFLASMSHELRTPLNGILGYTQILRRDVDLTGKQAHGINVIHQSAEHLLALINDVLDLSKIEARRLQLNQSDFDLIEFVRSIEELFLVRAREKSLRFATEFDADLPRGVQGDEQRLRQVLLNLIGNAIKFTKEGAVIFAIQRGSNGTLRFSVSDSGSGIAAEELGRIFEPFTQLGDFRQHAGGTGLGLAISRSLVELMGSSLKVDSRPGFGSRFWFELALAPSQTELSRSRRAQQRILNYVGARRRILVVDDNAANRDVLVSMLQEIGFEVRAASTGEEALVVAMSYSADLVLMDLRMPGMGGLAATRALRDRVGEALLVVAVSASAYDLDRRECLEAGCNDFLAKPIREEALWDILERMLGVSWVYHAETGITKPTSDANEDLTPTAEEADAIHELASAGDVIGIRTRMEKLIAREPRMASFAKAIINLAETFKMKAVRQYVAPWRTGARDSE